MSPGFLFSPKIGGEYVIVSTRNPVWVLAFFSVEYRWYGYVDRSVHSQSSMSPGFLFSCEIDGNPRQAWHFSQSSMSPGFLFSGEALNKTLWTNETRNPVWVLAFFSVGKRWTRPYGRMKLAIQYESWLSFQSGVGKRWTRPYGRSQSSMSPGFLFSW